MQETKKLSKMIIQLLLLRKHVKRDWMLSQKREQFILERRARDWTRKANHY